MKLSVFFILLHAFSLLPFNEATESKSSLNVIIEKGNTTSQEKSDGSIKLSVSGGNAPYQILIVSIPHAHTKIFTQEAIYSVDSLKAGKYLIHIADQNHQNTYSDEITIE